MLDFTLYTADCTGNRGNCLYPNKVRIRNKESFGHAIRMDHVTAKYKGYYRSKDNFEESDCIPFDCDNDHSENPEEWLTPFDIALSIPEVAFAASYSRHHNLAKGDKVARPRFHIFFPISKVTDEETYAALKRKVAEVFPYYDTNALDSARFLYGNDSNNVEIYEGNKTIIEFLEEEQKYTMVKKVTDHPSLFLVQAFTKMYGIPGLRLGYAMTSDARLRESMQQIRQPWSVSVPAQAAGIEALTEREEQRVQKIRNKIAEEKMRMEKKMREFGIRFIPTKANFFLLYSEIPLFERLLEQGILIRNCENYRGLKKGWYRIAVRTKEENDVLLRVLETILSKQ